MSHQVRTWTDRPVLVLFAFALLLVITSAPIIWLAWRQTQTGLFGVAGTLMAGALGLIGVAVNRVNGLEKYRDDQLATQAARTERDEADLKQQRTQREDVAKSYLAHLGETMTLLEGLLVDAENADDLLNAARESYASLQGIAQGDLLMTFGEPSPIVWADRACRHLVRKGLTMAEQARAERQTGEAAGATLYAIQGITGIDIDYGGPRGLLRWALTEAVSRWPQTLWCFENQYQMVAQAVAARAQLELPAQLLCH